jgi:hypothetical protein
MYIHMMYDNIVCESTASNIVTFGNFEVIADNCVQIRSVHKQRVLPKKKKKIIIKRLL